MASKLILSLLRDQWLILPEYAQNQARFINALLSGEVVKNEEKKKSFCSIQASSNATANEGRTGQVAVVDIIGPITKYGDWCTYGAEDYAREINQLNANNAVDAIVLNIDSPGGASTGGSMLATAIKNSKKPIVAYIGHGYAASAAYWAASQCSEIIIEHKTDSLGSIGAYATLVDPTGAYEKEGYKVKIIYAPQSSDKNGDYRKVFENEDESEVKADLFELVEVFKDDVRSGRGDRLKSEDVFTGKMYSRDESIRLGLADQAGDLQQAVNRAFELSKQSQNSKSNNMSKLTLVAIPAVLAWNGYEASEDGLHLSTADAQALDTHLAKLEADATQSAQVLQDLTAAQATVQSLSTEIDTLKADLAAAQAEAKTQKELADKYGAQSGSNGTSQKVNEDKDPPATNKEVDSVTAEAQKIYAARSKK